MYIYSVYDLVMKSFAPPFVAKNDGVAVRSFLLGAKKLPNINDLRLYRLGTWNDEDLQFPINPVMTEEIPVNLEADDE